MSSSHVLNREFLGGLFRGIVAVLAIAAVAVAAAAFIVPRLMGWIPLTILSGSMEPTYSPGDIVVVDPDYDDPQVGDIITFQPESGDSTLVTHRIIGVTIGNGGIVSVTTQGDNNTSVDEPVLVEQIQGEVLYDVPFVGYLTQPNVRPWLGGAAIAILVWVVVTSIVGGRKDDKDDDKKRRKAPDMPAENAEATPEVAGTQSDTGNDMADERSGDSTLPTAAGPVRAATDQSAEPVDATGRPSDANLERSSRGST